ncbi:MAG: protein-tyrosine-phosphatase [Bacteroidetes bacterium]|jgi:arsenate reductase|nr:protein-tyrosine-phosphatase [Bacteroidota bacterium]
MLAKLIFTMSFVLSLASAQFYAPLSAYIAARVAEYDQIAPPRRAALDSLANMLTALDTRPLRLVFICTHNSRRSQLAQIWAQLAAWHYLGPNAPVETYSGGTEATAFNERAVAALERTGLHVFYISAIPFRDNPNPAYYWSASPKLPGHPAHSKVYSDTIWNPQQDFVAVMVCSDADEACPYVPGASLRVALPYADPKASDGTPQEAATYDERCAQIAREMLFLFSLLPAPAPAEATDSPPSTR